MMTEMRRQTVSSQPFQPNFADAKVDDATKEVLKTMWKVLPTKKRPLAQGVWGSYVELPYLIAQLQKAVGLRYSISFLPHEYPSDGVCIAHCVVSIELDGAITRVSGTGVGVRKRKDPLDYDFVKTAETDALKRALRLLGLGLFQYSEGNGG